MAKTVFVGLSGGVDSAVCAALLKEQGYNVVGAFIKIWSPEFLECTWKADRLDAMRVCVTLGIPFREIDLSLPYKEEVVADMIASYERGYTPNPDVLCNRSIKFGHFTKWAFSQGADLVATGHYARVRVHDGRYQLLRGVDVNKDQSYFLYRLGQEDLSRTLFPIGEYAKSEVRALAKRFDLPNSQKPDSQGLCFVGDVSLKDFLSRFIELKSGDVVDENGAVIGKHDGAALYTIGERHGFSTNSSISQYVIATDIERNSIQVSPKRERGARMLAKLSDVHWIDTPPAAALSTQAQARYREAPFELTVERQENGIRARFNEPRIAAPGQSLVFYDGDVCLGGAIINS